MGVGLPVARARSRGRDATEQDPRRLVDGDCRTARARRGAEQEANYGRGQGANYGSGTAGAGVPDCGSTEHRRRDRGSSQRRSTAWRRRCKAGERVRPNVVVLLHSLGVHEAGILGHNWATPRANFFL